MVLLEEPVPSNMARSSRGTVSPQTTMTTAAGPSNLFRSGIHPSAVADSRMGQVQHGGQVLGAYRTGAPQPEQVQPVAGPSGVPRIVYSRSNPEPGLAWNDETSDESSESENENDEDEWESVPYEEYAPFITKFDSDGNEIKSDSEDQPDHPAAKKSRKSKPDPRKRK